MKTKNNYADLTDFDSNDKGSFFCWDLIHFIKEEESKNGTSVYSDRWQQAKAGCCFYAQTCARFERTKKKGVQLKLF